MKIRDFDTVDGNEAVARVAFQLNEVVALFPIPRSLKSREARLPEWKGMNYTLQVAVEDCTGCAICVDVCPAPLAEYLNLENRFKMLSQSRPEEAKLLFKQARQNVDARWQQYQRLAKNSTKENEKVAP